jgi:hypothetical protein
MCAATRNESSRWDQLIRRATRILRSHKLRLQHLKAKAQASNPTLEAPSATSICKIDERPSKTIAAILEKPPGQLLKKIHNVCVTEAAKTHKSLYANRRRVRRIAAILSIASLTIVAIATTRNTPQLPQSNTLAIKAEEPKLKAETAAVAPSEPATDAKMSTPPLSGEFGFDTGPAESSIPTQPVTHSNEPSTVPTPQSIPLPVSSPVAERPQPILDAVPERKAFLDIRVELTIDDGHVVEATVRNREPGAEAFEATALHIARQRRYALGTSRTETVVVRVATLGRNEP